MFLGSRWWRPGRPARLLSLFSGACRLGRERDTRGQGRGRERQRELEREESGREKRKSKTYGESKRYGQRERVAAASVAAILYDSVCSERYRRCCRKTVHLVKPFCAWKIAAVLNDFPTSGALACSCTIAAERSGEVRCGAVGFVYLLLLLCARALLNLFCGHGV